MMTPIERARPETRWEETRFWAEKVLLVETRWLYCTTEAIYVTLPFDFLYSS